MLPRAWALIVFIIAGSSAFGFEIGETVVAVQIADIRVGDKTVDQAFPGLRLTIGDMNGAFLWVNNRHPGWLESKYVVPLDQAIPTLSEMIRQKPGNSGLYYGRAIAWYARKEFDKAIADFDQAIRLNPMAVYYNGRGAAWEEKGELDKAIADYSEALRLKPNDPYCLSNRGKAWRKKRDFDKAISDLDEALRLDPKFASAYIDRGLARASKGEFDKAIADFDEALRIDPKLAAAYQFRGTAWKWKGEYDKVIADYGEVLRLDPKNKFCLNSLAWLWATCPDQRYRNGAKAVEYATKNCEQDAWKNAGNIDSLAAAYAETGNFAEAVKWQEKAIDLAVAASEKSDYQSRLDLYKQGRPYRDERMK